MDAMIDAAKDAGVDNINFLPALKYNDILASISTKLEPRIEVSYQLICIGTNRFLAICVDKSETPVSYDNEYYIYVPNNVVPIGKEYVNYKPTVFISYASPDAAIVDIVESSIRKSLKDKVSISRFTELHYKDSFKAFMNTIQDHDYVLCFVTYSYLRSRACMYEVGEVIKDHEYRRCQYPHLVPDRQYDQLHQPAGVHECPYV